MASVSIRHVDKAFGPTVVMKGIDLEVADGEFVVLVGPSGCGKSTLLRMIAGLEDVSAGRILIAGRDVTRLDPDKRRANAIEIAAGYVAKAIAHAEGRWAPKA